MSKMLPGKKRFRNSTRGSQDPWYGTDLNIKAKVVCEVCNNGWMSKIENDHAKPSMTDMILGKSGILITAAKARSIALFAFKTAVVLDHMKRDRFSRFFTRSVRHRFREKLEIPDHVRMWFANHSLSHSGRVLTIYHDAVSEGIELYVASYSVGNFAFQVLAENKRPSIALSPEFPFEGVAIPFWPVIKEDSVWPPELAISSAKEFELFASRWQNVEPFQPFG